MPKEKDPKKLSSNQREMLSRRCLDPKNYEFVKDTYCSLYVRDLRTRKIMIIFKHN